MQKFNRENQARRKIATFIQEAKDRGDQITLFMIERQIELALDEFELGTSNFWRLRTYFAYTHRSDLPREDLYAFNWGISKKSKRSR